MFAQIAVKLEARLGGLFSVDVEGAEDGDSRETDDESTSEEQDETPDDAGTVELRPRPRNAGHGVTEIEIHHGSDAELDGRLVAVSMAPGRPIVATVNAEHPHVITALERQPVNQMLLVSFIVGELSKELVKTPPLLIKTRLFTRQQLDDLVAVTGGEGIDLLPYVNRRLLDRVAA
jgi:hypothetical protein